MSETETIIMTTTVLKDGHCTCGADFNNQNSGWWDLYDDNEPCTCLEYDLQVSMFTTMSPNLTNFNITITFHGSLIHGFTISPTMDEYNKNKVHVNLVKKYLVGCEYNVRQFKSEFKPSSYINQFHQCVKSLTEPEKAPIIDCPHISKKKKVKVDKKRKRK